MARKRRQIGGSVMEIPSVQSPASVFYDSGSFTLWTMAAKYAATHGTDTWAYYDTKEFWRYLEHYVHFIIKHQAALDHFANVDVIPNVELSWRNQKYLEKRFKELGHPHLRPVPVIHRERAAGTRKTELHPGDTIQRYLDDGHTFIGLGGLVGSMKQPGTTGWLDACFDYICSTPDRTPMVRVHGFGVTRHETLWRYPWYSVDAASWGKMGAYGTIITPAGRHPDGTWKFEREHPPLKICVSEDSNQAAGNHLDQRSTEDKKMILDWLKFINIPLGENNEDGTVKVPGVLNYHIQRRLANMHYYWHMSKALPEYPWAFKVTVSPRFIGADRFKGRGDKDKKYKEKRQ